MTTNETKVFHYVSWPDTDPKEGILENVSSGQFTDVFLTASHEFAYWWMHSAKPWFKLKLERELIRTGTKLHLIVGCFPPMHHLARYPVENFYLHVWPMCWAYRIFHNHHFPHDKIGAGSRLSELPIPNKKVPTKHFLFLNNKPKQERGWLLDHMFEYGLQKTMHFSWLMNDIESEYNFRHWNECKVSLSDDYQGVPEVHRKFPWKEKEDSALEIVGETVIDTVYWTEKTFYPILHCKPFIIHSGQSANLRLKNYGFKLFDFVDYSFDIEYDDVLRTRMLAEELRRISQNYSPEFIYESTKEVTEFNRKRLFDIVKNREFIPFWKEEYNLTWEELELKNLELIDSYV